MLHFYYALRYFLESFLDFLMSRNSLFSSPKRFHISFSFVLLFSSFLFFQQFIFFCHLTPFLFLFFYSFLHLFLFDLVKVIYVYRFLFLDICLIAYCFIVLWVFSQGTFQFFFVHVRFKIERLLFGGAVDFRKHIRIYVLENILVTR